MASGYDFGNPERRRNAVKKEPGVEKATALGFLKAPLQDQMNRR